MISLQPAGDPWRSPCATAGCVAALSQISVAVSGAVQVSAGRGPAGWLYTDVSRPPRSQSRHNHPLKPKHGITLSVKNTSIKVMYSC